MDNPKKIPFADEKRAKLSQVMLYCEPLAPLDYAELKTFVETHGIACTLRDDPLSELPDDHLRSCAVSLARARVLNAHSPELNDHVYPVEIDYEYRYLKFPERRKPGAVYSAFHYQEILSSTLGNEERTFTTLQVFFTCRRIATYEDARWHLRTILLGFPVIISVTGIVEAPAREREYYILTASDTRLGESLRFHGYDWLSHQDERLTKVVKGYLLQALFFQWRLLSNKNFAFCPSKDCTLYNSHWQREVLHAQLHHQLCEDHRRELESYISTCTQATSP